MSKNTRKLSFKQRLLGLARVAKVTYKASPLAVWLRIVGIVINSTLPLIITYYAALTTSALAEAYAGNIAAGEQAVSYVLVTALLGVGMMAWGSLENYINQLVRYKIDAAINDQMYEHFLSLDFWRYDDKKTADLFDKSQRFSSFFAFVFDRLASAISSLFQLITSLLALLFVSWWLGLILVIAVIPGLLIQFKLSKARTSHWNGNIETRRIMHMVEWELGNSRSIAEIRLYGLASHLLNLRAKLRDKDEKQQIEFERRFIGWDLLSNFLEAAAEVVALIYTTLQIINRLQPVGQFLFVQQLTSRVLGNANSFVRGVSSMDEEIANLFDYNEFMSLPTATKRAKRLESLPENITFDNVSFRYPNSKQIVLKDVSLNIRRGQHVAIVGENGAGKSTFVKLLLGLYKPTKGQVLLDKSRLSKLSIEDWHRNIGVLQQRYIDFSFATAKENITLGDVSKPVDSQDLKTAMEDSGAGEFIEKLPKGLETYVNQWIEHDDGTNGVDLSGGQWQRLALARNFYRDSPIIILDEPTSAIDSLAESQIFKKLFEKKNKTIITISHRLTTVKKADVIYVFENGEIVESGKHADLVEKRGVYFKLFESQL